MEPRDGERQPWATAADFQGYTGVWKDHGKKGSTIHKKCYDWNVAIFYIHTRLSF